MPDTDINVHVNDYPTSGDKYYALFGDYDLDCTVGFGDTPLDAIIDLLDQFEE